LEFSTTVTWNCRGRQRIAAIDRTFIATQRLPNVSPDMKPTPWASARVKIASNPPAEKTTKQPTASRAASLISASKAMAATTP
jgi:hypothetical protein